MPTIQTNLRDAEVLRAACKQLSLAEPELGAFLMGSAVASGFAVRIPGWRYPVVFQLDTGLVQYGNSHGEGGELERFLHALCFEMAKVEAGPGGKPIGTGKTIETDPITVDVAAARG